VNGPMQLGESKVRPPRAALFCLAVAGLASAASFSGWLFDARWLSGLGIGSYPGWPLTALANGLLTLALLATMFRQVKAASALLTVPLLISVATLAEYLSGVSLGFDTWLFSNEVQGVALPTPGRPGFIPALSILLVSFCVMAVGRPARWADGVLLPLGSVTIGLASMSIALLLLGAGVQYQTIRLASSLPAAIAPIALVSALFVWRARQSDGSVLSIGGIGWRAARIALPIIVVLPAVLLPIGVSLAEAAILPPLTTEILASAFNLLIVVLLLSWAVSRIAAEHAALRESEARLSQAIDAHGVAICDWDVPSGRLLWSPGGEKQLGLAPGTVNDLESWRQALVAGDEEPVMAAIAAASARREPSFEFRYRIGQPDGSSRTIEGTARCFYDDDGQLKRVVGVNLDVTDREARAAALQASEAQLRSILETVPDAMIVIDERGSVRSFSAAAERLFGYSADAVIGSNVSMLMPAAQARAHDGYLARYLDTGVRRVIGRVRFLTARRADGTELPIELNVGEAWIGDQRLFTGFIRDISERVAVQERMDALRDEYAHTARLNAMGEVAAGLAHELNQPLAASANFLGAAEVLLSGSEEGERAADLIKLSNTQILRAGEIIRRLRDFIANGDTEMRAEPLEQAVRESIALGLVGSHHFDVRADCNVAPDASLMIADRIQIQQVLVNLLRNAAEALREVPSDRRVIQIASRAISEDMIEISVEDEGPGLSEEVLSKLYTPFITTKGKGGLGVGLSICRRIIEAHGGTMTAANRPEHGARIAFTVPRLAREQPHEVEGK